MCGHIGMMGSHMLGTEREKMIEDGLYVCALRGMDSVGLGIVPDVPNEVGELAPFVTKRLGSPPVYIRLPDKVGARVVIGHVRSATIGNKNDAKLAHPFEFDHIIGAHNGTLRGDWRHSLEEDNKAPYGSDSEAVMFNFAYRGVEQTVQSIYGAWCFVWWNDEDQTLNFLRNDERPLWFAHGEDGTLFWASEYWMIQAMARAGEAKARIKFVKGPDGKMFSQLPVNQWRRFQKQEGGVVQLDDTPLEGKTPPPPPPPPTVEERAGGIAHGTIFATWENGKWHECPEGTPGSCKLSKWFVDENPQKMASSAAASAAVFVADKPTHTHAGGYDLHGRQLWRKIAGVHYVSSPTGQECSFDEFMQFRTDGSCLQCGVDVEHPKEIGYIADDLSWYACKDCTNEWVAEEWDAADSDLAWDDAKEDRKMVTMGKPPVVPDALDDDVPLFGKGDDPALDAMIANIEASIPPPLKPTRKKAPGPKAKKAAAAKPPAAPHHQRLSAPPRRSLGERWDWWNDGPRS